MWLDTLRYKVRNQLSKNLKFNDHKIQAVFWLCEYLNCNFIVWDGCYNGMYIYISIYSYKYKINSPTEQVISICKKYFGNLKFGARHSLMLGVSAVDVWVTNLIKGSE